MFKGLYCLKVVWFSFTIKTISLTKNIDQFALKSACLIIKLFIYLQATVKQIKSESDDRNE